MSYPPTVPPPRKTIWVLVAIAWSLVGIPLAWGIFRTLQSAIVLFQ